jgi:hypothetical protein
VVGSGGEWWEWIGMYCVTSEQCLLVCLSDSIEDELTQTPCRFTMSGAKRSAASSTAVQASLGPQALCRLVISDGIVLHDDEYTFTPSLCKKSLETAQMHSVRSYHCRSSAQSAAWAGFLVGWDQHASSMGHPGWKGRGRGLGVVRGLLFGMGVCIVFVIEKK